MPVVVADVSGKNSFEGGARTGVRIVRMLSERHTSSNAAVNLLSRSWIKNRIGAVRSTNVSMMFRACWVAHSPVGFAVIPARYTCRVERSMNTSAYSRRNRTVSTVKKSQATIPLAWARRNCRHVSDERRGAGDRKSTRLNSSHVKISYAVFCLKKKIKSAYGTHITKRRYDRRDHVALSGDY